MKTATKQLTPLFKCPGGKSWAIERIRAMAPKKYNRFIEPFVGGGSVFLNVAADHDGLISDGSADVANVWWCVKHLPEQLMESLAALSINKEEYLRVRAEFNREGNDIDGWELSDVRAAQFIYLNRCGFNGLIRYNAKGEFNVPFGRHKNPVLFCRENVMAAHERLKNVKVTERPQDFDLTLESAEKGDWVFLDSPYDDTFSGYTAAGFGKLDQLRLASAVYGLHKKGVKFLLTNSNTPFIRALYSDFKQEVVQTRYSIGAQQDSRKAPREELFVWNY